MREFDIDNLDQYTALVRSPVGIGSPVAIFKDYLTARRFAQDHAWREELTALPMDVWRKLHSAE